MELNFVDSTAQILFNDLLRRYDDLTEAKIKVIADTSYRRAMMLAEARKTFISSMLEVPPLKEIKDWKEYNVAPVPEMQESKELKESKELQKVQKEQEFEKHQKSQDCLCLSKSTSQCTIKEQEQEQEQEQDQDQDQDQEDKEQNIEVIKRQRRARVVKVAASPTNTLENKVITSATDSLVSEKDITEPKKKGRPKGSKGKKKILV